MPSNLESTETRPPTNDVFKSRTALSLPKLIEATLIALVLSIMRPLKCDFDENSMYKEAAKVKERMHFCLYYLVSLLC